MRRSFAALFLIITMSACALKLIEPDTEISISAFTPVPIDESLTLSEPTLKSEEILPVATPISFIASSELNWQLIEVSTKLSEEPSVETEDIDKPYVETVSIPDGTPTGLGTFVVTAYCDCEKCNGKWTGHKLNTLTQAGLPYPVAGYTISVDPKVIPLGSVVELEGLGARFAQDTGSAIKDKRIDLFFDSHEEALQFGKQKLEVWIYKEDD